MGLIPSVLPPEARQALSGVVGMQKDLSAIRTLLERLVELEEANQHRGHVHVNNNVSQLTPVRTNR